MNTTPSDPSPGVYGFLQLCADRRYHRKTMSAFEEATGLAPDGYWIEAAAGGAAGFSVSTPTARFAYENGARLIGWAAHGDVCGGFPGLGDDAIEEKLAAAAKDRARDFPEATHWLLFGVRGEVKVRPLE